MKKSLSFAWRFIPGFLGSYLQSLPSSAENVDLPHCPLNAPVNYFNEKDYQGLFTYEKLFDCPDLDGGLCFLLFEGVMLKAHVYLNGNDLGEKLSGWVPLTFDITPFVRAKGNRLLVIVDSSEDASVPPFGKACDYLTFSGIYRPVYLDIKPKTYLGKIHVNASSSGKLHVESEVIGEGQDVDVGYALSFGGKLVKAFTENEIVLDDLELWDLDTPNLYDLDVALRSSDGEDHQRLRVGFRDAIFTEKGFFLNGKKRLLVGLNRHQNYPYVGPALPAAAQKDDADILKMRLGCNLVRTSHYPDSEAFLSRCDELGLLLIDEVPGWQYIGQDKAWRDNYYYFLTEMVEKERNHPCLVAYGTRIDESPDDDELYQKAVDYVHQTDPVRPCLGVRNFKSSHCLEDIYAYNDFSCSSLSHGLDKPSSISGAKKKPVLITEFNGHMFPTKQEDNPSRRLEHALRHLRVLDDAYSYPSLCGVIGWCAFDYNTHQDFGSGDHICYHGVEDIFRNPKAAAFAYASQNSKLPVMWIANPPTTGDYDEALMKPLYVFTNCDYVELYRNGRFVEVFKPDKKGFPHLPHPPIVIDDFIGALIGDEGFSAKDSAKLRSALNLVGQTGIAHIKKRQLLRFIPLILRNHLTSDRLVALYYKYLSGWGEKAIVYEIRGYKDRSLVCQKSYGPSTQFSYRFEVQNQALANRETYDVSKVSIKFVDEWGSQLHYANNVISFKTFGPIDVIGPKTVALKGGDISLYVRSLPVSRTMDARLLVSTELGDYPIDFTVQ